MTLLPIKDYYYYYFFFFYRFIKFLLIPGPLSRPCYLSHKSTICAGKITLVILPPSRKYSKLVRFLLGSGAKVYFPPSFLAESKPSTCGTETKRTQAVAMLNIMDKTPSSSTSRTPSSSEPSQGSVRQGPETNSDLPLEQGSWIKLEPSSPPAFQKQGRCECIKHLKKKKDGCTTGFENTFRFNR